MVVEDPDFETVRMIREIVRGAGTKAAIVDLGTVAAQVRAS